MLDVVTLQVAVVAGQKVNNLMVIVAFSKSRMEVGAASSSSRGRLSMTPTVHAMPGLRP